MVVVGELHVEKVSSSNLPTSWLDIVNVVLLHPTKMSLAFVYHGLLITPIWCILQIQILRRLKGESHRQPAGIREDNIHNGRRGPNSRSTKEELKHLQLLHKLLLLINTNRGLEALLDFCDFALVVIIDSIHLELCPHHGL